MSVEAPRDVPAVSAIDPVTAICLPIVAAPFGYLLGWLFVVHLVPDETQAVWLSTVVLTTLLFVLLALRP